MDARLDWASPSSRLVLDAVLDLLVERGYAGLHVGQIQLRSGLAGPALGNAPDVEALVVAALSRIQLLPEPEPTGSLRGDLLALLQPWRRPRSRDEMVMTAVLSAAEWQPRLKAAVEEVLDRPIRHAVDLVLTRALPDAEVPAWAPTLGWIIRGLLLERLRTGSRAQVDIERLVDFLVAGCASEG